MTKKILQTTLTVIGLSYFALMVKCYEVEQPLQRPVILGANGGLLLVLAIVAIVAYFEIEHKKNKP